MDIPTLVKNKRVLFVSTKNKDYIRNTQETDLLTEYSSSCHVIAFTDKNYLLRIIKVYISLLYHCVCKHYDITFISFAPQFVFPFYGLLKKKSIIITDFFISFYDTLVDDRKKLAPDSFLAKIVHRTDAYVLKRSDYIVADTKAHRDYFIEEFQMQHKPFIVLYLEADTRIYSSHSVDASDVSSSSGQLHICYFGSILPVQGIEIILKATQLLTKDPVQFTIIGPIIRKYNLQPADYPNVRFIEWLSQPDLASEIAASDLCLAGHFSGTVGKANRTIAGKTYIYKAMGKPVILGDSAANRELFRSDDSTNYYVELGNASALAACIRNIAASKKSDGSL